MKLYLHLFHGRQSPDEEMDDWGTDGPTFGPLDYVHTTYAQSVKLGFPALKGDCFDMSIIDDCLHYDDVYYGDWSVFAADGKVKTKRFYQSKTIPTKDKVIERLTQ